MIRPCAPSDFPILLEIINDAAQAYKGIIPRDCWHDPYMSPEELRREIEAGVNFWGWQTEETLLGIMGLQAKGRVTLIRHAYVRTAHQGKGIGSRLLRFLEQQAVTPILIGTWADAYWTISFYRKHGYRLLDRKTTESLLRKYWSIPERQIVTSVVLESHDWKETL